MSEDIFTDWIDGNPPLKGRVLASTLRWLRGRIQRIEQQGVTAEGIASSVQSADRRSFHLVTSEGRALDEIELLPAPFAERAEGYVAGLAYEPFDYWYDPTTRSSYVVRADHVATNLADALAGGKIGYLARGGSDAETYRGVYDPTLPYYKGDVVQTGSSSANSALWKAYIDIPAGVQPGSDFRWGAISVSQARDITGSYGGGFNSGAVLLYRALARAATVQPGFSGSVYRQSNGSAQEQRFVVSASGVGRLGTLTVPAGATTGTWAKDSAGYTYVPEGSVVSIGTDAAFHNQVGTTYAADVLHRSFTILAG